MLAHDSVNSDGKGYIRVYEGENAYLDDWIVVDEGDSGTILEVIDISVDTATSGTVTFEDVITGYTQRITLTNSGSGYCKEGVNFYGGTGYNIMIGPNEDYVSVTWGSGASCGNVGDEKSFPKVKLN